MARDSIRIADLRGLDGRRYAEESQASQAMRGGYNVELFDGEWWMRTGRRFLASVRRNRASMPWWWVIEHPASTTNLILASPWYAIQVAIATGNPSALYSAAATHSVDFVTGQATALSNGAPTSGQLFFRSNHVYRVIDVSGAGPFTITMDRLLETGTGNAVSTAFYDPIADPYGSGADDNIGTESDQGGRGSWCIVDQLVDHTATSLGYANPAVVAGRRYLVICSQWTTPKAIDLDATSAVLEDIFFNTSLTTPVAIGSAAYKGEVCTEWGNRLVIGRAPDPGGRYGDRTIWMSQVGDILRWHTGLQGKTGKGQYVTFDGNLNMIQAVAPLGEAVVVHREYTQETGYSTGGNPPVEFRTNTQGIGMRSPRSLVATNSLHYFWSDIGPCTFDLRAVVPIGAGIRRHLESMSMWRKVVFGFEDTERLRIYWTSASPTRHPEAAVPAQGETDQDIFGDFDHVRPMVVYDYANDAWWFEDHIAIYGAGLVRDRVASQFEHGRVYAVRFDGNIVEWRPFESAVQPGNSVQTGFDPGVTTGSNVVDAVVETGWMNFGSLFQKKITQLHIELRALTTTAGGGGISDLWSLATETLHFATLEIYGDGDRTTPIWTSNAGDMDKVVSAMLALELDENRQLPLMVCKLSPKASAQEFKFVFRNALAATSPGSGYTKGHFRLAGIEVFFDTGTSDRRTKPFNRG